MDWKTLVSQLADAERAPEKTLQTEQNTLRQQNNAYGSVQTQLTVLQSRITALQDPTLYENSTVQSSDSTLATASTVPGAAAGAYSFQIGQLATASVQQGTAGVGGPLSATGQASSVILGTAGFSRAVTAGTFTVNGQQITVATSDSLQNVFDRISSATGGNVNASYDGTADKISLNSTGALVLGSATDTSNFLQATQLYNNGTGNISSALSLGGINQTSSLVSANFATPVTDGGSGAGQFSINGVTINYSATADKLSDLISRINSSSAGVTV